MTISIEKILAIHGPKLSSDLKEILISKYNYTNDAARQKISRAKGDVFKLTKLPFPRNAVFVYLKSQYGSTDYWLSLHDALLRTKSIYGVAISALNARGGLIPYEHFKISCGSPLKQQKHLSPEQIKKRLIDADIFRVTKFNEREIIYLARIENHLNSKFSELQARLTAENIMLKGLYDWCRNLGLTSYKQLKIRDKGELPVVSTTAWDLAGFSYLSGLIGIDKKSSEVKPGFITIDLLLNHIVSESDIKPFIKKVEALKQLNKVGATLHFFVAFEFTPTAFKQLKKCGVSPATVSNLFGRDIAEGLTSLIDTLVNTAKTIGSPEKLNEVFEKLNRLEGATSQVRGALFEFLIAEVLRSTSHATSIELNKTIRAQGLNVAEIDVFAPQSLNNELIFAECKGLNPNATLPDSEVDKWLDKRIINIRQYCLENPEWNNKKLVFQLWTTAQLSEKSIEKIHTAMSVRKKYKIELFDKRAIAELLYETDQKMLLETFKVHFLGLPTMK